MVTLNMIKLNGNQIIGNSEHKGSEAYIKSTNPVTNNQIEPGSKGANKTQVNDACLLAKTAFDTYRNTPLKKRAEFLEEIAKEIENLGDQLIQKFVEESGLPEARAKGEMGRTIGQLKMFASHIKKGMSTNATIDTALLDRKPLPRTDHRLTNVPLGPIAVFGASNFPLAFSVAGGDTASALAAGCPVVVKGHSAHLGTSELTGKAILSAIKKCGMPNGTFSLLFGSGSTVGQELVSNKEIKGIGFTGSRKGGLAILKTAQSRKEPIPVFAEMSSINPVFLLPSAFDNIQTFVDGFITSLTMGAGQFCTNPGLLVFIENEESQKLINLLTNTIKTVNTQTMLTKNIYDSYCAGINRLEKNKNVNLLAKSNTSSDPNQCTASLFETTAKNFLTDTTLSEEIFGANSLIVKCKTEDEMEEISKSIEGQLTGSLHLSKDQDEKLAKRLISQLELKVGRIIFNQFPTGVEVCNAMVHGGIYPATSDSRSTSVGSTAINRFLRPICYQNFPQNYLREEIKDKNSNNVLQLFNGEYK
jgi:alpha-ketoglutaric semialdehyde dehydrogenase